MNARKPSQGAQIALLLVGLAAVVAFGYLFVISPKRSAAGDLDRRIQATEAQIVSARAANTAPTPPAQPSVDVAELFRLSKAMPDRPDMASVLLELNGIATDTGITFQSIAPQVAVARDDFQVLPINLEFEGNFYSLTDFLFRLRSLVAVRDGRLRANGRLFNVSSLSFAEGGASFPQIKASVTVQAFVFGNALDGAASPNATASTGTPAAPATQPPATPPSPATPTPPPPASSTATAVPGAGS